MEETFIMFVKCSSGLFPGVSPEFSIASYGVFFVAE